MIADATAFFAAWRAGFGDLGQKQVDGINALLAEMDGRGWSDKRWWAYVLATARHETAGTMQPIAEYGRGKGRPYGQPDAVTKQAYYGRGYVQLTWKDNYAKLGAKLGLDLVGNPDLAMQAGRAAEIMCLGMAEGPCFTGSGAGGLLRRRQRRSRQRPAHRQRHRQGRADRRLPRQGARCRHRRLGRSAAVDHGHPPARVAPRSRPGPNPSAAGAPRGRPRLQPTKAPMRKVAVTAGLGSLASAIFAAAPAIVAAAPGCGHRGCSGARADRAAGGPHQGVGRGGAGAR
ncbi:MAG: glycoside hydrolase family 19 protein [Amaricoccus sp.]